MPDKIITRIAPTPSGYLHLGNLANFLLIEKMSAGGELHLRIDDCDATRTRPEFVEHIFETLSWLKISWNKGPKDSTDFERNFSQITRKAHYFNKLLALTRHTYACTCSRKELESRQGCACRSQKKTFVPGETAIRLHLPEPALATKFGDVILWRKDNGPAYHWASVVDDIEAGMNLIVRGEDLRESSELQKEIAALLSTGGFSGVRFLHHPLLTGEEGKKLAKSQNAPSVLELRNEGASPESLREKLAPLIGAWASGV